MARRSGTYYLSSVAPGTYSISVSAPRYPALSNGRVVVSAGKTATENSPPAAWGSSRRRAGRNRRFGQQAAPGWPRQRCEREVRIDGPATPLDSFTARASSRNSLLGAALADQFLDRVTRRLPRETRFDATQGLAEMVGKVRQAVVAFTAALGVEGRGLMGIPILPSQA